MSVEQFRPLPRSVWVDFGRNFRQLRLQRGLTQKAFANDLGTNRERISKIERGKIPPPISHELYSRLTAIEGMSESDVLELFATAREPFRPIHRIFSPIEDVQILLTLRSDRIRDNEIDILQTRLANVITDFMESK